MNSIFVVVFIYLISTVYASNCGSNCPSGACGSCPCGDSSHMISEATAGGYFKASGLDVATFACIATHESGYNANAMNQNGNYMAVGLLQVTDDNGYSAKSLCDAETNVKAAASLYSECGICAWLDDAPACFDRSCCSNSYCNRACRV